MFDAHIGCHEGVGNRLPQGIVPSGFFMRRLKIAVKRFRGQKRRAQQHLVRHANRQIVHQFQVFWPPIPRFIINCAKGAQCLTVGAKNGHANIGDHVQITYRQIVLHQWMARGMRHHQRLGIAFDMLAERVAKRGLAFAGPGFRQAKKAFEILAVFNLFHDRDQRDRGVQQLGCQARHGIICGLKRGVCQAKVRQGKC